MESLALTRNISNVLAHETRATFVPDGASETRGASETTAESSDYQTSALAEMKQMTTPGTAAPVHSPCAL
jgi:hypothetical protein